MDKTLQFLQISGSLYKDLATVPKGEERSDYIEQLLVKIDKREILAEQLKQDGFVYDENNKQHKLVFELDKGIRERLENISKVIKDDLKLIKNSQKKEAKYINPYSAVQVMDGMYYDKKK